MPRSKLWLGVVVLGLGGCAREPSDWELQHALEDCQDELTLLKVNPICHETVRVTDYGTVSCPPGTIVEVTPASASANGGALTHAVTEVRFAVRCKCPE